MVALKSWHDRYVTALGQDKGWWLKAETRDLQDYEKFTLLCLDHDKIALKSWDNRYVTALGSDSEWFLKAETRDLQDYEKFTLVEPDTEEQLPCLEMFKRLEAGEVKIALKSWHDRYVTALGQDNGWWLKAETRDLQDYEKFTVIPQ